MQLKFRVYSKTPRTCSLQASDLTVNNFYCILFLYSSPFFHRLRRSIYVFEPARMCAILMFISAEFVHPHTKYVCLLTLYRFKYAISHILPRHLSCVRVFNYFQNQLFLFSYFPYIIP